MLVSDEKKISLAFKDNTLSGFIAHAFFLSANWSMGISSDKYARL